MYTSDSQWGPIMGDYSGASSYPLWYAHYDGLPTFSDFSPFNGWSSPAMKVSISPHLLFLHNTVFWCRSDVATAFLVATCVVGLLFVIVVCSNSRMLVQSVACRMTSTGIHPHPSHQTCHWPQKPNMLTNSLSSRISDCFCFFANFLPDLTAPSCYSMTWC